MRNGVTAGITAVCHHRQGCPEVTAHQWKSCLTSSFASTRLVLSPAIMKRILRGVLLSSRPQQQMDTERNCKAYMYY